MVLSRGPNPNAARRRWTCKGGRPTAASPVGCALGASVGLICTSTRCPEEPWSKLRPAEVRRRRWPFYRPSSGTCRSATRRLTNPSPSPLRPLVHTNTVAVSHRGPHPTARNPRTTLAPGTWHAPRPRNTPSSPPSTSRDVSARHCLVARSPPPPPVAFTTPYRCPARRRLAPDATLQHHRCQMRCARHLHRPGTLPCSLLLPSRPDR